MAIVGQIIAITNFCVLMFALKCFRLILFSYEPELHPGVTYKIKEPKATLKIFSTGSITITGKINFTSLLVFPQADFIRTFGTA